MIRVFAGPWEVGRFDLFESFSLGGIEIKFELHSANLSIGSAVWGDVGSVGLPLYVKTVRNAKEEKKLQQNAFPKIQKITYSGIALQAPVTFAPNFTEF